MKIDRRFKPWLCAAGSDSFRPELEHVWVTGDGRLFAASGFILVVLPVELEAGDQPGPVWAGLLRYADQHTKRDKETTHVSLKLARRYVRVEGDGSWHQRCRLGVNDQTPTPKLDNLLNDIRREHRDGDAIRNVAFNPELLRRVGEALGADNNGLRACFAGVSRPILIDPRWYSRPANFEALPDPPFGLLMPMHDERRDSGEGDSDWSRSERDVAELGVA